MRIEPLRTGVAASHALRRLDGRAWLIWLLVAAGLAMVIRNPLYSIILVLVSQAVLAVWGRPDAPLRLPIWRLGLFMVGFSTLFNALSVHLGNTVLFRLPAGWPLVGGAITLEAVLYGAANGLLLLALLGLFLAFNAIVPGHELVRLTPPALHDLGLVVLIAISYVPEMMGQLQRIREAQAIRGHRLRGLRDWRPIMVPLLVGGLERSMGLAEAMTARGYGATADEGQTVRVRLGLVIGLVLAIGGWTLSYWLGWPGWLLLGAGAGVLMLVLWRSGRRVRRTEYRARRWSRADSWLLITAVVPLLILALPGVDRSSLNYNPYPQWQWPPFDPLIGLGLLLLAAPVLSTGKRGDTDELR